MRLGLLSGKPAVQPAGVNAASWFGRIAVLPAAALVVRSFVRYGSNIPSYALETDCDGVKGYVGNAQGPGTQGLLEKDPWHRSLAYAPVATLRSSHPYPHEPLLMLQASVPALLRKPVGLRWHQPQTTPMEPLASTYTDLHIQAWIVAP